ncbi:MAG: Dyp-type peroxidase [Nitrososphaeraceae archaeon]|nr:Dyp-type peroxidase [Nitrososphaeraceae archaeon]MDW0331537.1 Dyp-type peroxidase [Nitrososphaeraceae archaeon]
MSLAVALSFQGLKALGVPEESLASFPPEFQQGMAARAGELGDVAENAPENWEKPLGSRDLHLVVVGLAPDTARLEEAIRHAREAVRDLPGVVPIWQQDVHSSADLRNMFGFADGIAHPAVEGSGIPGTNPYEEPLKAGEFVLGYEDEIHSISQIPQPEVLRRNGTYAVFRKLHTRVAAFRQLLRQRAKNRSEEEWLASKIVGRWPSGAPLALAPDKDDPGLGADPKRNNAFMFGDDPRGLKSPFGSHVRRMNPRDSIIIGVPRLHRMIRRGTNYGPPLPPEVQEDDGIDRGLLFAFVGAHLDRQFEFIQKEWANDGKFIGAPVEKDPLVSSSGEREFTIPKQPIRLHLKGLPAFVVNRGGEYCFMPGLRALSWLAKLNT